MKTLCCKFDRFTFEGILQFQSVTNLGSGGGCQLDRFDHFRFCYFVLYLVELIFFLHVGERYLYRAKINIECREKDTSLFLPSIKDVTYFEIKVPFLVAIKHRSVISLTVRWNVDSFVTHEAI